MKICARTILGFLCCCLVFSGLASAQDQPKKSGPACPECAAWAAKIAKKKEEIKIMGDKIRVLKEDEKAKEAAEGIKMRATRVLQPAEGKKDQEPTKAAQRKGQVTIKDPAMNQLATQRGRWEQDLKALRGEFKDCQEACKAKR